MANQVRGNAYMLEVKMLNKQVWDGIQDLRKLQAEWTAEDYGTTLPDGTGLATGLNKTNVGAVVFATMDAFKTLLDSGYATNMASIL